MTTSLATAGGLAALAALAGVAAPHYRRAAGWFALAAIGQGAALAMVQAGPLPRYQHYAPIRSLAADHPWLVATILLQAVVVAAGLIRAYRSAGPLTSGRVSAVRVVIALALSVVTAATVSAEVARYVADLAVAVFIQLLGVATIVLMARAFPSASLRSLEQGVNRLFGSEHDRSASGGRLDAVAWTAAALAVVLSAALCVLAYDRHPHIPDEVVYLHQAKYLAQGLLTMPSPPVAAGFDVDLMDYEPTRWFSPVPPGWPAVLAVGAWLGAPWLVNPVLAGINVLLTFVLLGQLYSRRLARGAAALLAISPWFLFLGMSYMTHQFTLTCALAAAVGVVQARRSGRWTWALLAGAGVGATSLIRPLDGVIVGALIALWSIGIGGTRLKFSSLVALGVGTAALGALIVPYNWMLTGNPARFPINAYVEKHYPPNSNAYGFGKDRGMGWALDPNPGHGPVDGLINANLNTFGINVELFGWYTGSLVLVAWLLCSGTWKRQDTLMMAVVVAFAVAYFFFYFGGGPDFGARYYFPVIVPLVALTVRGLQALERSAGARAWVAVGALSMMTLVTYVPWRSVDKYHNYRGMRADIRQLASAHHFGADLVLVRGKRFPDYASAFAQNPVDLESKVAIYAWDRDAETRSALLRAYPERRVWLVDGPSVTGGGFRVASGPIAARALMAAAFK